ncbi:MAG: OmpH family outer membrane protein [Deinococcota bacterium]|jgi:Skp family chaperone for outer membrane proteins|nr:OmpH family outer membrane protein [Deinococcota bacterium]
MTRLTAPKLKAFGFTAFALIVAAFAFGTFTAQDTPTRVVFIDSARLFDAHPQGGEVAALIREREEDLAELRTELEAIVARVQGGQEASLEDRQRYEVLARTIEESNRRWAEEISAAAEPISAAIDGAISTVAQENGYNIVLDGVVASTSGLIVYADSGLDVTESVIERIR